MAIFYDGLWKLMGEKGVSQQDLADACRIATNSITRMKRGEYISIETIDRICNYFECDFADVISRFEKEDKFAFKGEGSNMDKLRSALVEFMKANKATTSYISKKTGMSLNTVKAFLAGKSISLNSISKLIGLDNFFKDFLKKKIQVNSEDDMNMSIDKKMEVEYIPAKPVTKVSYKVFYKLLSLVPSGMITRREDIENFVARKLNVDYVAFDWISNDLNWKYSPNVLYTIPYWREVSTRGVLMSTFDCSAERQEEMLIQEGHKIVVYGQKSKRVEDYKLKLFDFDKLDDIDIENCLRKQSNEKIKVVTYIRTATEEVDSIEEKRELLNNIVTAHSQEWEIVGIYEDIGESGNDFNRKNLSRLFEDIKKNGAKLFVTVSPSMIARDMKVFNKIKDILDNEGVEISFV